MFRTTVVSDPAYESNHLRFIAVKTPHLRGRGDICVFVPPTDNSTDMTPRGLPLVILLHGVYGSAWSWSQQGGAHLIAQRMIREKSIQPMVIAMPSDGLWGDGSGYLPHDGYDFEQWIAADVPAAVRENVEGVSEDSPLFIGGLSMGGFGALRIGSKYPNRFRAVSAHSSITGTDQMPLFVEESVRHYETANPADQSVWNTLQTATTYPALRFDCGTEDHLLEYNRTLHRQLTEAGIPHTYEEFPGGHDWKYWQDHLRDSLRFFSEQLG